mmetsp:Transcript_4496/g.9775  ORF Transcript_4496/g.9775 Transcript_4496/m.9775 type:complete len:222 (+) Transcript_4496:418-1083(+)
MADMLMSLCHPPLWMLTGTTISHTLLKTVQLLRTMQDRFAVEEDSEGGTMIMIWSAGGLEQKPIGPMKQSRRVVPTMPILGHCHRHRLWRGIIILKDESKHISTIIATTSISTITIMVPPTMKILIADTDPIIILTMLTIAMSGLAGLLPAQEKANTNGTAAVLIQGTLDGAIQDGGKELPVQRRLRLELTILDVAVKDKEGGTPAHHPNASTAKEGLRLL